MKEHMTEPSSGAAGIAALIKIYGLKAVLGMVGSALLYLVLPPTTADGKFDRREFVVRLACAGVGSCLFGDWTMQLLTQHAAWLHAEGHKSAVDLMTGAPFWWVTRAAALWLQKRKDKDIAEVIHEAKEST